MWDEQPAKAGTPRWIAVGIGVLGLTAAALLVAARVHDLRKARAEADRAEEERARKPAPPVPTAVEPTRDRAAAKPPQPPQKDDPPAPAAATTVAVYKVRVPGDVVLSTDPAEVENLGRKYPGAFAGEKGHTAELFGYAHPGPRPGTVRLRRYAVGARHVYTTRDVAANPNYREEPFGAWVYESSPPPGASLRLGFMRRADAVMDYAPADKTDALAKVGFGPTELRFYLFDPPTPSAAPPPPPPAKRAERPRLVPVYKVVFPGDVLLTTSEAEARAVAAKHPGEFRGAAGHHQSVLGYAYAAQQPGAERLQRYLTGTGRHTYWLGDSPAASQKAEGPPIWVPPAGTDGASRRLTVSRKDGGGKLEFEYGNERTAESFRKQNGYQPAKGRDFFLFDKADGP